MGFLNLNTNKECPVSAVGGIEAAQAVIDGLTMKHCSTASGWMLAVIKNTSFPDSLVISTSI
jgi:hypothetical protein